MGTLLLWLEGLTGDFMKILLITSADGDLKLEIGTVL